MTEHWILVRSLPQTERSSHYVKFLWRRRKGKAEGYYKKIDNVLYYNQYQDVIKERKLNEFSDLYYKLLEKCNNESELIVKIEPFVEGEFKDYETKKYAIYSVLRNFRPRYIDRYIYALKKALEVENERVK